MSASDLQELEVMLAASGVGNPDVIEMVKENSQGLGLFVRSLIGLDRGAAKEAFADFLAGKMFSANQIQFIDLIVNYLTEHGIMQPALLYESPFTDISPQGPESLFESSQVDSLVSILDRVRSTALAG